MAAAVQRALACRSVRDAEVSNSTRISASAASVFAFQMGSAQSAQWGRQLACRSGGAEMEAARGQMAMCGMTIVLMGVAASFAVAIGHGATAQHEYPAVVSPNTSTQHMCACRSLTVERTVPQAEVSDFTLKAERNPSIKPSTKGAVKSAKWGWQPVRCYLRANSCPACTC